MPVLIVARARPLIDRIVSLISEDGFSAEGTTSDEEAVLRLDSGEISTLVIGGGVEEPSRQRLKSAAHRHAVSVVEGAARGKDPETYVREELLPALRSASRSP